MNKTQAQIATIQDYARQIEKLEPELNRLHRAAVELRKELARLPVADVLKVAELERREQELAEKERAFKEKWARAERIMKGAS